MQEKRREAEACAAVWREVTRSGVLPEAGLVDRSDVANRQDGRASGRTTSVTPFFGLTESARRPELLPTTDRVAQLTAVRSATNFLTALAFAHISFSRSVRFATCRIVVMAAPLRVATADALARGRGGAGRRRSTPT